jgi:hypothetical protein
MLFSLSRGRVYNRRFRLVDRTDSMPSRTVLALNRKARYSLARDRATASYLAGLGIAHARLGGCPTLFLDRVADRLPRLAARDRAGVLISVRNPSLMNIPLSLQARIASDVARIIELLRARGHRDIRLLCHDHRDIPFATTFSGVDFVYTGDVYTYLAMLRECSLNVTYRLHSALPCLAYGTPAIPIVYDERGESALDTFGIGAWCVNLIKTDDFPGAIADRLDRLDQLRTLSVEARAGWERLYAVTIETFQSFARDVRAFRDGTGSEEKLACILSPRREPTTAAASRPRGGSWMRRGSRAPIRSNSRSSTPKACTCPSSGRTADARTMRCSESAGKGCCGTRTIERWPCFPRSGGFP